MNWERINKFIRMGVFFALIIVMIQLGSMNGHIIEDEIKDYCGYDINYSIAWHGLALGLWKNEPNYTFGNTTNITLNITGVKNG